jgi:hypothetical protein
MVQTFGNKFLARAALADHQHRAIERRGAARPLDGVEKGQALADELIRPLHQFGPTVGGKSHHLARIFNLPHLVNCTKCRQTVLFKNMAWLLLSN